MSYRLRAIAIHGPSLAARLGECDPVVRQQILERSLDEASRHDEWFRHEIAEGDPTLSSAIDALLSGAVSLEAPGYVYGYALVAIAEVIGHCLFANSFEGIRYTWIEEVDAHLTAADAPPSFRLEAMMSNAIPDVVLPAISDFPALGWTSPETLRRARAWITTWRPSEEMWMVYEDLQRWLDETPEGWGWLSCYA